MVFGNVIHTEPGDVYMARVVGIKAGVPESVPAYPVIRLCGTGVQAIVSAAQAIQTGEASVALAGGAESMSRGPYWMPSARWGARDEHIREEASAETMAKRRCAPVSSPTPAAGSTPS